MTNVNKDRTMKLLVQLVLLAAIVGSVVHAEVEQSKDVEKKHEKRGIAEAEEEQDYSSWLSQHDDSDEISEDHFEPEEYFKSEDHFEPKYQFSAQDDFKSFLSKLIKAPTVPKRYRIRVIQVPDVPKPYRVPVSTKPYTVHEIKEVKVPVYVEKPYPVYVKTPVISNVPYTVFKHVPVKVDRPVIYREVKVPVTSPYSVYKSLYFKKVKEQSDLFSQAQLYTTAKFGKHRYAPSYSTSYIPAKHFFNL